MKKIMLVAVIAILAAVAYLWLQPRAVKPAALPPISGSGGKMTCFHIDIPENFKIVNQNSASCRLTLMSTDQKYEVTTFIRAGGDYGDLSKTEGAAKATRVGEACQDPKASSFQPGVLKSVVTCPQHINETYVFKPKDSKLQDFSPDPQSYLFVTVVTRDPAAPLPGDQVYGWLKPSRR